MTENKKQLVPVEKAEVSLALPVQGMTADLMQRTQEVMGAIMAAKKFPRDEGGSINRMLRECGRESFANIATFAYPRGGQTISGGTIRLAEMLAKHWGNIKYGTRTISQTETETKMEAFAWDMENNVTASREFIIRHERKAHGRIEKITDPRDIYEHTANYGMRRVRACLFEVLPNDVMEMAVVACKDTVKTLMGKDLSKTIATLISSFQEVKVSEQELVEYCERPLKDVSLEDLSKLREIFKALKTEGGRKEDFFGKKEEPNGKAKDLKNKYENQDKAPPKAPKKSERSVDSLDEREFLGAPTQKAGVT